MTILNTITYYLVHHPTITTFHYTPNTTPFSSLAFLLFAILTYLSLTLLLSHTPPPPLPPRLLRLVSVFHNLIILILSFTMALGTSLATLSQMPTLHWLFCFPVNSTPPSGPVFFWAYVFYLSKFYEFVDTALIVLSGSFARLTFLHVYHHATVVVMCYIWLETSQSLFPIALVTNASVHTIMYAYYLLCTLGIRPKWKRLVTNCQIIQFVFSFLVSLVMLYYHFSGFGCCGIKGWCFNALFNASLLYLFLDFHSKSYNNNKKKKLVNNVGDKDKGL